MAENFDDVKPFDIKKELKNSSSLLMVKKKEIHDFFTAPVCINQLKKSLPHVGITADRMIRILFSSIAQVPKLANCSPKSLFNVMIQCAQIGLEPNTALGHAYIIPYGNTATLIIGYKGLIELCRRSKEFAQIIAHEVYPSDYFELSLGTESYIKHTPSYEVEYSEQEILGCYAVAKFKDGSCMFEYMPKFEIDKIRARSVAANSGPWVTDYMMMARKTVIRRLLHYLPLTIEMAEAIKVDGENEAGINTMEEVLDDVMMEQEKQEDQKKIDISLNERQKVDSSKKELITKPKENKIKKEEKPQADMVTIDLELKSLEMRGISETEVCAYFNIDSIFDIDKGNIEELKHIVTEIESERMAPEKFKQEAANHYALAFEMKKEK